MPSKRKRVSAFRAKQIEESTVSEKAEKAKLDECDFQTAEKAKSDTPLTRGKIKERKKRKSNARSKECPKGETVSQFASNEKIDSIQISDDDSDSCVIVEDSASKSEEISAVGKSTNLVNDSTAETEKGVRKKHRRGKKNKTDRRKQKESEQSVQKSLDSSLDRLNEVGKNNETSQNIEEQVDNKKRRLGDTKDYPSPDTKKSKLNLAEGKQGKILKESSDWETIGSRAETDTSDGDQLQNELETEEDAEIRNLSAIPVDGSVLVIASHPCNFPLKGRAKIQALVGVASIMGYHFVPGRESCDVFSPDCNSLITISTVAGKSNVHKSLEKVVSYMGISEGFIIQDLEARLKMYKPYVILKFDCLETNLCSLISSFNPYTNIFKVSGKRSLFNKQLRPLCVGVPSYTEVPELNVTEALQSAMNEWKEILEGPCEDQPVIMVCGGKNSGKSTTNRLLINSSLNLKETVYYLECDIGQTEFTPPGVVSLVAVTAPVLGPPFTHQRKPLCSFHYGGVSPKDNPDLYMRCVQLCVEEYRQVQKPGPLIVNTMGWMKGLGWQLLMDTVRLVCPSVMVQLTSNQNSQNVSPITVDSLEDTSWTELSQMYDGPDIQRDLEKIPKIIHLDDPVAAEYNFKIKAAEYRNLTILSHLGNNLEPGMTLTSVTPYIVSWKDVAIHMCSVQVPRSQVMYALNANLVALCEGDISKAEEYLDGGPLFLTSNKPFSWVGYGLVRGVDMEKKEFYIITSLSEEELARVNVLDIGGVTVPENFLISQKCERNVYIDEIVVSVGLSAVRPRKHMPRRSKH